MFYFIIIVLIFVEYNLTECKSNMEPYIIGGKETTISSYPHSVYLSASCVNYWICGSSVLNQRILLTAAHCISGCKSNLKLSALAGHENLDMVPVIIKIKQAVYHEFYREDTIVHDIALIFLSQPLPLGKNIQRVILPHYYPKNLQDASVAGWGIINEKEVEAIILKSVNQIVRPRNFCSVLGELLPGQMCAGSIKKNAARPAEGDSGSALITKQFVQIGVVSFKILKYPALVVYTNVSYYMPWIEKNIMSLYCSQ